MAVLAVLYLAGLFYGAVSSKGSFAEYYISAVVRIYKNSAYFELSCYLFLSQLMLLGTVMFFGVSCVGAPAICLVPFCSGAVNGSLFAYLTLKGGIKGAVGYFVMLWFPLLLHIICLIYFASQALMISVSLFRRSILNAAAIKCRTIKSSLYIFFGVCIAAFAVSLLQGGFIKLFIPVFL